MRGTDDEGNEAFARSTYLAALSGVKRKDYDADRAAKWTAQFHPLVTQSVDRVTYRQFNYQRQLAKIQQEEKTLRIQTEAETKKAVADISAKIRAFELVVGNTHEQFMLFQKETFAVM